MNLRIDVHHYHHLPARESVAGLLESLEEAVGELRNHLAELEARIAETEVAQDAATRRITDHVAAFNTSIADLEAEVASLRDRIAQGEDDPELVRKVEDLETRMATIKKKSDAQDPTKPAVLPEDGGGDATDV